MFENPSNEDRTGALTTVLNSSVTSSPIRIGQ